MHKIFVFLRRWCIRMPYMFLGFLLLAVHFCHILKYSSEFKVWNQEVFCLTSVGNNIYKPQLGLESTRFERRILNDSQSICSDETGCNIHSESRFQYISVNKLHQLWGFSLDYICMDFKNWTKINAQREFFLLWCLISRSIAPKYVSQWAISRKKNAVYKIFYKQLNSASNR